MEKMPSVEQSKREIIADPEQFRQTMRRFWQKEFNAEILQKELESRGELHAKELLKSGYDMEALRSLIADEEEKKPSTGKDSFLLASQNLIKRELVAKAAEKQGMFLQETLFGPSGKGEETEHDLLKGLIKERRIPTIREYGPKYFSIDVAEAKVSQMSRDLKGRTIVGGDIVVFRGKQIFEKPKNQEEALKILKDISGKETIVSFGVVVLLTPADLGRAILLKEGANFSIKLRRFSEKEAEQYLRQNSQKYLNIVGVLDYADPLTRQLMSDAPVKIETLEFGRKIDEAPKKAFVSPDLLPQLKDYFMGVPMELVGEMLKRAKSLV